MFRLDKVLRWKERLEKEALARRAAAEAALYDLERAAARLRDERVSVPDTSDGCVDTLVRWAGYAEALRRQEERVRLRAVKLRPEVEEARRAHLEIRREVEGLRKLKERTRRRHLRQVARAQQEILDDAASRPFLPGSGSKFPRPGIAVRTPADGEGTKTPVESTVGAKRGTGA
jgi:flagellar export protein FliJ